MFSIILNVMFALTKPSLVDLKGILVLAHLLTTSYHMCAFFGLHFNRSSFSSALFLSSFLLKTDLWRQLVTFSSFQIYLRLRQCGNLDNFVRRSFCGSRPISHVTSACPQMVIQPI